MSAPALGSLLGKLPVWVLVGGKGGVGKTTCAAALGLRSSADDERTLLISTDPARTLGEAIGVELSGDPRAVPGRRNLFAAQLDAEAARTAFLARWRDVLVAILDRGTYLDASDIQGLVDAALPGTDEAMALLTLAETAEAREWNRLIVDTAPTGHTLRLLSLPQTFATLIQLLDSMQEKHRFMVSALTHSYRRDVADEFIDLMRSRIEALRGILFRADHCAMVLVARAEPLVTAETRRYADALAGMGMNIGALLLNAVPAVPDQTVRSAVRELNDVTTLAGVPRFHVPQLERPPEGLDGLERWGAAVRAGLPGEKSARASRTRKARRERPETGAITAGEPSAIQTLPLTIVAGKGGVGKTTVACALGVAAARSGRRTLVVSTDPAPSVSDAFAMEIGDADTPVPGPSGLFARQMDAAGAFSRMRDRYTARIDELFDSMLGPAMDATHDRRIMRDLLALAPPGIDEVYALAVLGETLGEGSYDVLIVDPAPTGHLLRLVEMPAVALDWAHRLIRLILKYGQARSMSELSAELLAFSRRTRTLAELLVDHGRCGAVVVALNEPLVRGETRRLLRELRARSLNPEALLWNRARGRVQPLPDATDVPQFVSAELPESPRGAAELARFHDSWRSIGG